MEFKATAKIKERGAGDLRLALDAQQAGGNSTIANDHEAERTHRQLLFDAAYCHVAAGDEVAAHRCFQCAGEAEFANRIVSAHTCMICTQWPENPHKQCLFNFCTCSRLGGVFV